MTCITVLKIKITTLVVDCRKSCETSHSTIQGCVINSAIK